MEKKSFGAYIRSKREQAELTQRALAERLHVVESAVSKWERGLSYPDVSLVPDICRELSITEHEFFTACDDEKKVMRERADLRRQLVMEMVLHHRLCSGPWHLFSLRPDPIPQIGLVLDRPLWSGDLLLPFHPSSMAGPPPGLPLPGLWIGLAAGPSAVLLAVCRGTLAPGRAGDHSGIPRSSMGTFSCVAKQSPPFPLSRGCPVLSLASAAAGRHSTFHHRDLALATGTAYCWSLSGLSLGGTACPSVAYGPTS